MAEGVTTNVAQAMAFGERQLAGAFPCPLLEVGDVEVATGGAGEHPSVTRAVAELFEVGAQYGRFRGRYFRRNPLGTLGYIWDMYFTFVVLATVGRIARALKIRPMVERIYYWMLRRSVRS